jgi:hypothetical protein
MGVIHEGIMGVEFTVASQAAGPGPAKAPGCGLLLRRGQRHGVRCPAGLWGKRCLLPLSGLGQAAPALPSGNSLSTADVIDGGAAGKAGRGGACNS